MDGLTSVLLWKINLMYHFIIALFSIFILTHHEIADEPAGPISIQSPASVHIAYKNNTGYRAITFWMGLGIRPYVGSMNHLWCDDYPFWKFDQTSTPALLEWTQTVRRCVRAAKRYHLPPPMMVGQGFGNLDGGEGVYWRCPRPWERWKLIQIAQHFGAAGILWWRPTTKKQQCAYT